MKYQLLFIGTLLLFFACRKEETLPNPNPGPDPNCLEQSTIFAPDNKAAKIVSNLAFSGQVYDFQMLTPEVGYLFGASPVNNLAVLLKTTNGGKTFGPSNLQVPYTPLGCTFKDLSTGIVTLFDPFGCPNCQFRPTYAITRDGGESWTSKTIPGMNGDLYHPQFDAEGRLYAMLQLGSAATLVVSEDSGENWDTLFASPEVSFLYQDFSYKIQGDKIYLLGTNNRFFVLDKQGNLLNILNSPTDFIIDFWAFDDQNLLLSNYSGVFKTSNSGNTWEAMPGVGSFAITFESMQKGLSLQTKGWCGSDILISQDVIALTTDGGQNFQAPETATSNLRFTFNGAQRVGPGKYLALFGRQLLELNIPQ